ncbi:MAG: A/G-specific adenine glycosylase [Dehalococcoidia bacterium]|nr:A/G-specific adenine glycosylase [Dehalococcoidia bacterium]
MKATAISARFDAGAHDALMQWYRANGRHSLPWRLTRDPYAVLVSEVMLQQTQVERVLPYFERWLTTWPGFTSLAAATPAEVIDLWAGLGYNRRALNLHRLARSVVTDHRGELPVDAQQLLALPGVGPYTAAAVCCFARRERMAVVDTNIARVIARALLGVEQVKAVPAKSICEGAEQILPLDDVRDHNLALMDLGAVVCAVRGPSCDRCPIARRCAWRLSGSPSTPAIRGKTIPFAETARFARGRIVDALRGIEVLETDQLAECLPERHRHRLADYLAALQHDGLIEQHPDGRWSLPGRVRAG